ncbi:MAG: arsenate reductase (glutaredoxin) [Gammaproteobacteria bacterium]|nr:arsenate reductase (glutaredoxin) [Gammaproteobacteria bacterium]
MDNGKLLHNPRCSKSRQTLALLQEKGMQPKIIEYLKDTPEKAELQQIISLLGISAHELLRSSEEEYKALGLSIDSSESDIISAMTKYPKLIQRPVFIYNNKATIGRPPENVLTIL